MGSSVSRRMLLIVAVIVVIGGSISAGPIGEAGVSVGAVFPQGNFSDYADVGPRILLRANFHIPQAQVISGYLDLSGSFFSSESEDVLVWVEDMGTFEAEKQISQYNIALHAGLQLGSSTRRGAIRPRVAFAPGLYLFNTQTTVTMWNADEAFLDDSDAQVKFGWRGIAGCDFFLTTRWGISAEFVYDQVINLHHETEYDAFGRPNPVTKSARFHGLMVGVVIAMK